MVMPLAFGVAPPSSLSCAPSPASAPEPDGTTGDERKKSGDCVCVDCSLEFLGVACDPRFEACDASDCSCSSGPGLLVGMAPRSLRRGVADADVRCERRFAGDDIL